MREFSKIEVEKIKQAIESKKQSFPQDWLGRALAYTPYQPRTLCLNRAESTESKANCQDSKDCGDSSIPCLYRFSQSFLAQTDSNPKSILQIAKNYENRAKGFLVESLEILTFIRRYVQTPLIYDFLILDSYQLLESLVYGADAVILTPKFFTQKELRDLSEYALKIGLERIFRIDSKEDLTKSIFAQADFLDLDSNFSLIPLIPNGKILLSEIPEDLAQSAQPSLLNALDARILAL